MGIPKCMSTQHTDQRHSGISGNDQGSIPSKLLLNYVREVEDIRTAKAMRPGLKLKQIVKISDQMVPRLLASGDSDVLHRVELYIREYLLPQQRGQLQSYLFTRFKLTPEEIEAMPTNKVFDLENAIEGLTERYIVGKPRRKDYGLSKLPTSSPIPLLRMKEATNKESTTEEVPLDQPLPPQALDQRYSENPLPADALAKKYLTVSFESFGASEGTQIAKASEKLLVLWYSQGMRPPKKGKPIQVLDIKETIEPIIKWAKEELVWGQAIEYPLIETATISENPQNECGGHIKRLAQKGVYILPQQLKEVASGTVNAKNIDEILKEGGFDRYRTLVTLDGAITAIAVDLGLGGAELAERTHIIEDILGGAPLERDGVPAWPYESAVRPKLGEIAERLSYAGSDQEMEKNGPKDQD